MPLFNALGAAGYTARSFLPTGADRRFWGERAGAADPPDRSSVADVFISYSRQDGPFVRDLSEELTSRGREVWVDLENIPPTAEWWLEIESAITAADAFLFVISPESLLSATCRKEVAFAVAGNKRLVPVQRREVKGGLAPPEIARLNWIRGGDEEELTAVVSMVVEALDTDLEHVKTHTRLAIRAREWETRGGERSLLLRGTDLVGAERWLAGTGESDPQPSELQRRFIAASRRAAMQRKRALAASVVAFAIVASLLAYFGLAKQKEARSRELASLSVAAAEQRLDRGLLLALAAWDTAETVEAKSSLVDALESRPILDRFLHGHTGPVQAVAFAPHGRVLASAGCAEWTEEGDCAQGAVLLWNLEDGAAHRTLVGHEEEILSLAFSAAGSSLATGDRDGRVLLWDLESGASRAVIEDHGGAIRGLAFGIDGGLFSTGDDGQVLAWNGSEVRALWPPPTDLGGQPDPIRGLALDLDGRTLAAIGGGQGGQEGLGVVLLDGVAGDPVARLDSGGFGLEALAVAGGRRQLVAASLLPPYELLRWDLATMRRLEPLAGHGSEVWSLAFAPGGESLVSGGRDGSLRIWDPVRGGAPLAELSGHTGAIKSVAVSPDGGLVASAGHDGLVVLWRLELPAAASRLARELAAANAKIDSVAWSPDARWIAAGRSDGVVMLIGTEGQPARELRGHDDEVWSLAFGADGEMLASGARDGSIVLWETATGGSRPLGAERAEIWSLAFSPRAAEVLLSAGSDGLIKAWDARAGSEVSVVAALEFEVRSLAFSPDGGRLAAASCLRLNEALRCERGQVSLWDASSWRQIETVAAHDDEIWSVAFSPDGGRLASAGADARAVVWGVDARGLARTPLELEAGNAELNSVAFSPRGEMIIGGAANGDLLLWDVATGQRVGSPLRGHRSQINALTFGPLAPRGVTAADDGRVLLWDLDLESWRRSACRIANRELTAAEWGGAEPTGLCDERGP